MATSVTSTPQGVVETTLVGVGQAGAVAPGGLERLVTRPAGRDTVVVALRRSDRAVLRSHRIRGRWSVPAVTLDNGTTGLSADGRTLVLARPTHAFPPATTRLAVLDARRLKVRRYVVLQGVLHGRRHLAGRSPAVRAPVRR
jgi:hypothetical protein